ncbi:hypothetical protein IL992_33690 [Microbispora sp. NEAU-D428]|uniref:hypothetical protein n=1 Tax=Microbispora sitophila TaxID=2771537 RepID=UPI0018691795|nr:hypothetical protein [Microbispora sitophila]MBE3014095.1 hypothetical protein [Microbispora sitophila]
MDHARLQEIADFSHDRGRQSLRLAEQLETCLVVLVLGVADSEKEAVSRSGTSAAHLGAQDLLMAFGKVRFSLERGE